MAVGDFDRDGLPDLATADFLDDQVTVRLNTTVIEVTLSPPGPLAFGDVDIDVTAGTQTVTITNTGDDPNTLASIALGGADPGDFQLVTSGPDDCTTTTPLAVGDTCDVRVRFDPASTGAKSAKLTVTPQGPQAPIEVTLTGTGTQTAPPPVTVAPPPVIGLPPMCEGKRGDHRRARRAARA